MGWILIIELGKEKCNKNTKPVYMNYMWYIEARRCIKIRDMRFKTTTRK